MYAMSLEQIPELLIQYQYLILFPLAIVEGPIITVIAGFLITTGVMNPIIAFPVIVIGDMLSDAFWYFLGRFGRNWGLMWILERWAGVTKEKLELARQKFINHRYKMMTTAKLTWGLGTAGLTAAGLVRTPYLLFATTCAVVSAAQAAIFLLIGILFGKAYTQIAVYLDVLGSITLVLGAVLMVFGVWYFFYKK
jgi:membrane protein DedA with SNARE-associated domain